MTQEITLRISLVQPPAQVAIGLQKGTGRTYETLQIQTANGQDLTLTCSILVKGDERKDSTPSLSAPFVQGPKDQKFMYLDIGTYAGQMNSIWGRRLKISLSGITWNLLGALTANTKYILETKVLGTGKDGGPNCATVRPFAGWLVSLSNPLAQCGI